MQGLGGLGLWVVRVNRLKMNQFQLVKSNVNNNEFHPKFSIPVATKMVQMLNLFLSFLKQ